MPRRAIVYWEYGDRTRLAELSGLALSHVSGILSRSVACGARTAKRLSAASKKLGKPLPLEALINNLTTRHPGFWRVKP